MRVLFTTFSARTHLYPMVPLAWAFRVAGHEVVVASQPILTDVITEAGLPAVSVGADFSTAEIVANADDDIAKPVEIFGLEPESLDWEELTRGYRSFLKAGVIPFNDSMVDDLVDFAVDWRPDLVIWEPITFAGAVAARVTGAAHARLLWGQDVWTRTREHFVALRDGRPAGEQTDLQAEWLTDVLQRHGATFHEDVVNGQWTIDPMPAATRLAAATPSVPMQYVPYNGRSPIPNWLREPSTRPRICVTIGISQREYEHVPGPGQQDIGMILDAIADLDAEVVVTLTERQQAALADSLRHPNVRAVEFVPLHALLPTCAAVVHHGGAGTYSTALAAGVPQLIIPNMFDTVLKARQLTDLGAGLHIHSADLTGAEVRAGLVRMLTEPSFQESAARLRQESLADPTPGELVPILESMTMKYRTEG
ncbi:MULTISPECIES: activator-dependent family glycosyltransferase [Actinoalloteichus]|uniref:Glycosyl transferase, UDP-glucuronosyltransferase n=1 Tax=Actinoalloteichus fjordicus TaxID=1612552 RepID=A0AAC9LEQ0_9PSEU|nr:MULTISPECIES: activator-dependent family glycosyltransferase [Actinoalloteichus]APU15480.1 glycosyl transferase, UDP-glucuronosyltransferase [Actinoalloteichus fjordicus]APU21547.1 glycosyl transferase, UDP-glucuronosyltransferase [Actinoalloteichus sp. GBA129-24]